MIEEQRHPIPWPLASTLGATILIVGALVAGGISVRASLANSFTNAEKVRGARILVADVLRAQIDEETGIRGYVAGRQAPLLQPYYEAQTRLPELFRRLEEVVGSLRMPEAATALADAARTNALWVSEIAEPSLAQTGRIPAALRGKRLVDEFRADLAGVDAALARREIAGDIEAERAIIWVGVFAAGAILAVAVAAALFTVQQYSLNARLEKQRAAYEVEKRIADTLQGAFAQSRLPAPARMHLSATYVPASEALRIGGDWYDALELPEDRVLLAIGDVVGHGIEAAVAMNATRHLFAACALRDLDPGHLLERTNAQLVRMGAPIVTLLAALVNARTQEFAFASGGHPPPVIWEPGGRARFLEGGSLPLGVLEKTAYRTQRIRTVAGAMIVLYTDGAVEHSHDVLEGEALLLAAVERTAQMQPADAAAAIHNAIFAQRQVSDDVAILTVRFGEGTIAQPARGEAWTTVHRSKRLG